MINCIQKFDDPNTVISFLQADELYTGTIANQFGGAFFKFEMVENETIFFTLRIKPNTTQPINVRFTLYRKEGENYIPLGTSINDEFYNTFDYDAIPAEYYICITTDYSVDYELEADFTDYPFILIANCDAYGGEYIPPIEFARPTAVCDSPIFYQLIKGTLPRGLEFSSDGLIYGVPKEQDCEPVAKDMPPSFTWWEENENGDRESTSLDHHITVRAALVEAPETYADRDFIICVRNNWDQDRDHFMGLRESWETPVYIREVDQPTLELTVEKPEIEPLCKPCETDEPRQATLQELQELAKQVQINDEFKGLVSINNDGLCEVCDEPTDVVDTLTEIDEICEPCPEPTVVKGLQLLPDSLCPCPDEEVEPEPVEQYVLGIPKLCYPSLLREMINEKVCDDRPGCPPVLAIYPESKPDDSNKLGSLCDPCEE